jgi:hypothetical protein
MKLIIYRPYSYIQKCVTLVSVKAAVFWVMTRHDLDLHRRENLKYRSYYFDMDVQKDKK